MQNDKIAKVLDEIADMLEPSSENFFHVRAYRNTARAIYDQPRESDELWAECSCSPFGGHRYCSRGLTCEVR